MAWVRFCATFFSPTFLGLARRAEGRSKDAQRADRRSRSGSSFDALLRERLRMRPVWSIQRTRAVSHFGRRRKRKRKLISRGNKRFACARKSLKSLWAPNQSFRGIVCFQWLNSVFVSPFSRVVCFQWLSSPFRFAALAALASRLRRRHRASPMRKCQPSF